MTPDALRIALATHNMKPSRLAAKAGVSPQTVSNWLSGRYPVPDVIEWVFELLDRLADGEPAAPAYPRQAARPILRERAPRPAADPQQRAERASRQPRQEDAAVEPEEIDGVRVWPEGTSAPPPMGWVWDGGLGRWREP